MDLSKDYLNLLLCAGPTAGKTTFKRDNLPFAVEAEELFESMRFDSPFSEQGQESNYAKRSFKQFRDEEVGKLALIHMRSFGLPVISNLWGKLFIESVIDHNPISVLPIFVYRPDPKEIFDLCEERGTPVSMAVTRKWVHDCETYAPHCFHTVIALRKNQFLSDVISFRDGGFSVNGVTKERGVQNV